MRQEVIVGIAARDFAEEIEIPQVSGKSEIQAGPDRFLVPREQQIRRRIAQIRSVPCQDAREVFDIFVGAGVNKVDIVGGARRTVHNSGDASNENKIDTAFYEDWKEPLNLRTHG